MQKIKIVSAEYQIKNNPFVKVAPTVKNIKLIARTPDHLHIRQLNRNHDVPYCDNFGVEEDWQIMSLPGTHCSAFRLTQQIVWYKSTMMKSVIKSNTEAESKNVWTAYQAWVLKSHAFKERKRPKG